MKKITLKNAKKAICIADNDPEFYADIDSSVPYDENWESLGDDYFLNQEKGICGPSGGDPQRTFISFENYPHCPICNGGLLTGSAGEDCLCFYEGIREYFGI